MTAIGPEPQEQSQGTPEAVAPKAARKASAAKLNRVRKAVEQQIDEFVKSTGFANPAERTDKEGWRWFEYGNVKARAGVVESTSDGELYLRTESLMMEIPADGDEAAALLRELLEANMTIAGSARLGISGEGVFVCSTLPVAALVVREVPGHIESVVALATRLFGETGQGDAAQEPAAEA